MMRKTIFAALAALMILLTMLGGCQLAVDNDEMNPGKDRLCGVFVTLDYLDMSFADEPIEIPPSWNGNPNSIVFPERRIDATRTEEENGHVEYTFDGIEGFRLFEVKVNDSKENSSYWSSMTDSGIEDVHVEISDESVRLSGTISYDVHTSYFSIYANPVYQTPEGDVYMIEGSGISFSGDQSEGTGGSTTLSETITENTNGEETSRTTDVEIKVEAVNTNKKVVLKQMGINDEMITQTEITQDDIPKSIQIDKDTEYMIMEEHCVDYEGKASVKRTLLSTDEATLGARFTGDNGIIETTPVTLKYAGEEEKSLL